MSGCGPDEVGATKGRRPDRPVDALALSARPSRLRRFAGDPLALAGLGFIVAVVLAAWLAPALAPYNPNALLPNGLTAGGMPLGPSPRFPLGTDQFGRDELSRLLWGGRTSIGISVATSLIATSLGAAIGLVGGYLGGTWDNLVGRLTDVVMAFPVTLLAIAMVLIVRPSAPTLVAVMSLILWTYVARLVRAEALTLKEADFVLAARALGASRLRIVWRHLLPHVAGTAFARFTLGVAQTMLLESSLSFLGAGIQPPTPDWGLMIAQGQDFYAVDPPLVMLPGALILLTALAFTYAGDGVRRILDPVGQAV